MLQKLNQKQFEKVSGGWKYLGGGVYELAWYERIALIREKYCIKAYYLSTIYQIFVNNECKKLASEIRIKEFLKSKNENKFEIPEFFSKESTNNREIDRYYGIVYNFQVDTVD